MSKPQNISELIASAVARGGDRQALACIHEGQPHWRTWNEVATDVRRLAAALVEAGVQSGDRVVQISENRYEWIITDFAIHLARAVHVPIHTSLPNVQILAQIADCGARVVLASTASDALQQGLDDTIPLIFYDDTDGLRCVPGMRSFQEFVDQCSEERGLEIEQTIGRQTAPEDLASILYTSGTTGNSRGVMLSQRNLVENAFAINRALSGDENEVRICCLPLSHIYARTCDLYVWLNLGAQMVLVEDRTTIIRDCQIAKPTSLNAVPYFYQKVHDLVRTSGATDQAAALRETLGGRLTKAFSGGAALAPEVEHWFETQGLPLLPGYGLTESSPVIACSNAQFRRKGSVGRPLPGVEIRIADDGEILARGSNIMLGYWQNEAATKEAVRDGWLHTGDLGELDADGYLYIRGRKKEIMVLSTGKNVAPTRVEGLLCASPLIEQVAVIGDNRNYLGALIVPATEVLNAELQRLEIEPPQDLLQNSTVRELYELEIAGRLADAAPEEQVHAFCLLHRAFSIEAGELTPKLSLKREGILRSFQEEIEGLFRK